MHRCREVRRMFLGQGKKVLKRASESSIPSFFDREAASSLLWQFLEEPRHLPPEVSRRVGHGRAVHGHNAAL